MLRGSTPVATDPTLSRLEVDNQRQDFWREDAIFTQSAHGTENSVRICTLTKAWAIRHYDAN